VVASLVDALPLPCRFSDGTFAAVVAGYRCAELCCYHCASFFPVDTWPPWFLSSGCFAATIVSLFWQILGHRGCSLADALPLQLHVSFQVDTWPPWFLLSDAFHCCHIGFLGGCLAAEPFGTFPGGYFAATVVGSSPRCHHGFTAL